MNFPHFERELIFLVLLLVTGVGSDGQGIRGYDRSAQGPTTKELSQSLLARDLRGKEPPVLTATAIVDKLLIANDRRSAELRGFQGTRLYHLQYHGLLGTREAEMKVLANYTAPDQRDFSVVSQSGSKLLLNRVLLKLLDSEKEALQNRKQIELSPANYQFDLLGTERLSNGNPCYVLAVKPLKENKFLYRGKIWVDAADFAVTQMEGQPAKSPSFWIKDTAIESRWAKVGDFWFIQHNASTSHVRMGGMAVLTIDYANYQVTAVDRRSGQRRDPAAVLPDPASVTPQR